MLIDGVSGVNDTNSRECVKVTAKMTINTKSTMQTKCLKISGKRRRDSKSENKYCKNLRRFSQDGESTGHPNYPFDKFCVVQLPYSAFASPAWVI